MLQCQHEADAECERQELEILHCQLELEQDIAIQQQWEQEQQHLDDLYQEYGPQSAEQHAGDQVRNQAHNDPDHDAPIPPVQEPIPPNQPDVPLAQPPPPPPHGGNHFLQVAGSIMNP